MGILLYLRARCVRARCSMIPLHPRALLPFRLTCTCSLRLVRVRSEQKLWGLFGALGPPCLKHVPFPFLTV